MAELHHHVEALLSNPAYQKATADLREYYYNQVVSDPLNSEWSLRLSALEEVVQQIATIHESERFRERAKEQRKKNN